MAEFGTGRDKYRSRRNRNRVRELFLREWDPIGVNGSGADDEYDTYADKAYVMLMHEGRSVQEIADYLYYISSEYMGIGATPTQRNLANVTAEKLVALRPDFEAETNEPF
jgi:hypothetical protein